MKNLFLNAVLLLGIAFSTSVSLAAPKVYDIRQDSILYRVVEDEIIRAFPKETIISGILTCYSNNGLNGKVECDYELGMYRCDDGGMAGRWIRVIADLRNPNRPVVFVDNKIAGGCN